MAVQAQYPSNILLLNRSGQDRSNALGGDYSLQPQPGGFLDQSHMFFSNGVGTNPRKRGREAVAAVAAAGAPIDLFSLQSQTPPTLVNLAQLHNQQPNVVSTGLRLAFGDQQQQQHQHHQQQQQPHPQQQQQSLVLPSSIISSFLTKDLAAQLKQQRDEIDQFLQAQGDQLRRTLAERRQRHYRALLGAVEESAARRLREKDAEVEKAARRHAELEERVAQLRVEAQVWQAKVRQQEATAASLQAQIQQAMMSGGAQGRERRTRRTPSRLTLTRSESCHRRCQAQCVKRVEGEWRQWYCCRVGISASVRSVMPAPKPVPSACLGEAPALRSISPKKGLKPIRLKAQEGPRPKPQVDAMLMHAIAMPIVERTELNCRKYIVKKKKQENRLILNNLKRKKKQLQLFISPSAFFFFIKFTKAQVF
uniref:Uncharacterized protein n=1 Tax=Nelumbo nucifera TaxID=4432 RepID=A0A822ZQT9_NELNU|nr:TPA_asm: hypothetical protein HUJ06_017539 [Nelumbo nucifera]